MKGIMPPGGDARKRYSVNKRNQQEIIWQSLYDSGTYLLAGQSQLTFFQIPNGSGGKTFEDTNMEAAGQLPSPQSFLCTGISVDMFPAALPGRFAVAGALATNLNDIYEVFQSGFLEFNIGSKNYLREAPVGKFPSQYRIAGVTALATGLLAESLVTDYASVAGVPFNIIPFTIPQTQNFKVTLNWDTNVAITADMPIRVNLHGFLYRDAQ